MIVPILSNSSEPIPFYKDGLFLREYCPKSKYRTYYIALRSDVAANELGRERLLWSIMLEREYGIKRFRIIIDGNRLETICTKSAFLDHLRENHPDDFLFIMFNIHLTEDVQPIEMP